MVLIYRFVLISLASCLTLDRIANAIGAVASTNEADDATERGNPAANKGSIHDDKKAAHSISLSEGRKTPMRKLISTKKQYYKRKAERKLILAKPDDSKELSVQRQKQALLAKIEHERSLKSIANKKRYRLMEFAIRTDSATLKEQQMWESKLRTKAYRSSSPTHEKKYQRFLQNKKEKDKLKRKAKKNKEDIPSSLQKRGEPRSFDLNIDAEEPTGEQVESHVNTHPVQEKPSIVDRSRGKTYIPVNMLTKEQRDAINARKRMQYQQRKQKWKEALTDESKMTPKLKKQMENFKAKGKAASHRYVKKLKALSATGEITQKQAMTLGMYHRNKTWREASPTNMKLYKEKCKKDYARALEKKKQSSKRPVNQKEPTT
ncbi:uncharacterized protein FA14DRAFT_153829 [Meira miltonrushii]|uniref:Uncharacterized protein n=1 Tax=Meira miltonrushii TaxID=1280837 RepID=A0A316VN67_9BASI|nr:uncharacterized protein FA14DRAFT_153829 [Meira miltonrushii]PWN38508.1 hypothetical protein FA14DRAFT_153829 [Meira miltonrushii]